MLLRGHIHWARLDKRRPVVLLSPDARNALASDVIIVPCSTLLRLGSWHVRLRKGEGGLPEPTVAKCEQITTIPKSYIEPGSLGGPLSAHRMVEIERAVLRAIGVPI